MPLAVVHSCNRSCMRAQNLKDFRAQGSHLFQGRETLQPFMRQDDLIGVAKFVDMCLNKVKPPSIGGGGGGGGGVSN